MKSLAPQRGLQPVGDVALDLALHMNRPLADARVERHCLRDGRVGRLRAADDLDERNQMRRVERMTQHHAFRMPALGLHRADRQPRRTRCEHHVGRRGRVHAAEQVALEVEPLGAVLLHEVGIGQRGFELRMKAQPRGRCAVGQAKALQRRPVLRNGGLQARFGARRRIERVDIETLREKVRSPARADDAGRDDRDATDFAAAHKVLLGAGSSANSGRTVPARGSPIIRRASDGVATSMSSSRITRTMRSVSWMLLASSPWRK